MDATRDQILDTAEQLAQARGFNAFSYRDIAQQVGIKAPSIHYHFPSKDDLGVALVERYRQQFAEQRAQIDRATKSATGKLERFNALFRSTLSRGNRMCLCGMLAAEYATLARSIQLGVQGFWTDNERWLSNVLDDGRTKGDLRYRGESSERARLLLSCLEGAMLTARVADDPARFDDITRTLLEDVRA